MNLRALAVALATASAASALASAAQAGPRDDTLRVAFTRETDFVDRIHTDAIESTTLSFAVYDTLIYDDPTTGQLAGLLAKSWNWIDDKTIEFDLREGVKFHNGEEFDADDVVYTVNFVADMNNKLRQQPQDFGFLHRAEKIGKHKVRVHLKEVFPLAEHIFATRLLMWPDQYTSKEGHNIHVTKPIGSGPYVMTELRPGQSYVMKANPDYFAGPKPKAKIGTVSVRTIADVQTQVAEMMAGGLDLVFNIPEDQAKNLALNPNLQVAYGETARYNFLSIDAAGRTGDTPLKNVKVRQAIAHAIDREAIVKNLVGGKSVPIVSNCHPKQAYCEQSVPLYRYDPARARQLLAEAGFPNGFKTGLLNGDAALRPVGEAIQGYLRAVGITAEFETFTLPAWRNLLLQGKSPMSIVGWGAGGIYDTGRALPTFFNSAEGDYARDAEVSEWIDRAAKTADKAQRKDLYSKTLTRIAERAYSVPLFTSSVPYVMAKELDFRPDRDTPEFVRAGWKR